MLIGLSLGSIFLYITDFYPNWAPFDPLWSPLGYENIDNPSTVFSNYKNIILMSNNPASQTVIKVL